MGLWAAPIQLAQTLIKDNMKILFLTKSTDDGCFEVRGTLPIKYLRERGHDVKVLSEEKNANVEEVFELLDWCEVLSFNRMYSTSENSLLDLINYAKLNGKRVIYDTDDLLVGLPLEHPSHDSMKRYLHQISVLAKNADVVTVTGSPLLEEYSKFNENISVLPNCVDPAEWKLRKPKKKLQIGWTGTISHISDLLLITDVIRDLQKERDFDFTIFGLINKTWKDYVQELKDGNEAAKKQRPQLRDAEWYTKLLQLDRALKEIKWKHIPFVPIDKYRETLSKLSFDIGLCPLEENKFNSCKSAIKFYEYAMVGTVTLASNVLPYAGEVNYTAKNRYDKWYRKLKALIDSEEMRKDILGRQREWVLNNRNIEQHIAHWEQVYAEKI